MRAVASSQILILQLLLHFHFSSMHMLQFCTCDFFVLCLCSNTSKEEHFCLYSNTLKEKHFCFAAWPKGQRITMVVWITCTTTLQHFSDVANSPKHPCRRGILWSQSLVIYNDLTSDSTSHVIACDDFTRSRNLLCRYNNRRYYCWAEKLMLRRNWALWTKPTIRYLASSVH